MPSPSPATAARLVSGTPEQLTRAATDAITAARSGIAEVTSGTLTGTDLLEAYDEATDAIGVARVVAHLTSKVQPDPAARDAAEAAEQELDRVATEISQDPEVYAALAGVDLAGTDPATAHWVTRTLLEFRRAGVDRDAPTRERVSALRDEMVGLEQLFSRNIDSDTRTVRLPPEAVAGLPEDWVRAHPPGEDGLVAVATDYPDIVPFLAYATDAGARERVLRNVRQRGHPANREVLRDLLARRHELATLLGYPSWAAYATENKMIGTAEAAADFITEISAAAEERMRREYQVLLARKREEDPSATAVERWDVSHLTTRVKAEQYRLDPQELREYFEYGRTLAGLLALCGRLFGVAFTPDPDAPVWHPDVSAYLVTTDGEPLGRIFLDMHPRPDKFSHAAMFGMGAGKRGRRIPEATLVCNFPGPGELLEYGEAQTMFHEFGHLLHHVLAGRQRWAGCAGLRMERDFVEAPSQLLEEWTKDLASLATFAAHHRTGEPIPATLVDRLRAADEFGDGLQVRQQLAYAALSLELHRRDPAVLDPAEVEREVEKRHSPYPTPGDDGHFASFGHLTGYSATYYTYQWSLVIAKDLASAFEAGGFLDPALTGRYRDTVLAPGCSVPAAQLVRDFLGRDHTFDAYRRWLNPPT